MISWSSSFHPVGTWRSSQPARKRRPSRSRLRFGEVVEAAQLDAGFSALIESMIAADMAVILPGSFSFEAREELSAPAFFYRWFIVDRRTGGRKLMPEFMTCAQAVGLYPGAQPDLRTCESSAVSRTRLERY